MKSQISKLCLLLSFLLLCACNGKIARSAQNKTTSEASKKVNKKIGDVFNGKKKKTKKVPPEEEVTKKETEPAPSTGTQPTNDPKLIRVSSDFVPGTKVIFIDTLVHEQLGEFPSKWDLESGSVEVMQLGEENVIGFTSGGTIFPLIDQETYLPEKFTLEFDCYFHQYGNEGYILKFKGDPKGTSIRINHDGAKMGQYHRTKTKRGKGWRHVELSFNKRALKLYFEGERLINIPRLKDKPLSVQFSALAHGKSKEMYAMIKNIRIAEGAVPLYDRLSTDGKLVFNDIHFDYNKAKLKAESLPTIIEIATLMKEHPELRFSIEGHTDSDGTEAFNQRLSEQRALAVKAELVNQQISSNKLQTKGWGESKPLDINSTSQGKAKNRRVEFIKIQ